MLKVVVENTFVSQIRILPRAFFSFEVYIKIEGRYRLFFSTIVNCYEHVYQVPGIYGICFL